MSIFEPVPILSLEPTTDFTQLPFTASGYGQLLRWILWDPHTLERYVASITGQSPLGIAQNSEPKEAPSNNSSKYSIQLDRLLADDVLKNHLAHFFMLVIFCLLLIGLGTAVITANVASRPILIAILLLSWLLGLFMASIFVVIGFYTGHLAIMKIWAFYFGVGLPALFLQEFWIRREIGLDNIWLLAGFGISCGLFVGALLNNTWSIVKRYLQQEFGKHLALYLQLILLLFYFLVMVLYYGSNSSRVGNWQASLCLLLSLGFTVAAMYRIDDYFLAWMQIPSARSLVVERLSERDCITLIRSIPRVTYLSPPQLTETLGHWLEMHEKNGLLNAHQMWCQTNLHGMIKRQIILNLAAQSDGNRLISRVEQLAASNYTWTLEEFLDPPKERVYQASISVISLIVNAFKPKEKSTSKPTQRQKRYDYRIGNIPSLDENTSGELWRAAIAGYLYLDSKQADKAAEAFAKIQRSDYADELERLSHAFARLLQEENLVDSEPGLAFPHRPRRVRHQQSWEALTILGSIHHSAWLYRRCQRRRQALLKREIQKNFDQLAEQDNPYPEEAVIEYIASCWNKELDAWFNNRTRQRLQEVDNPFTYTEPLIDSTTFVGREEELRLLQQFNRLGHSRPILLHGLPKVGKTALLHRFAAENGHNTVTVPIFMEEVVRGANVLKTLTVMICQSIARALDEVVPQRSDLEAQLGRAPLRFLHDYIDHVCNRINRHMLVLALDDLSDLPIGKDAMSNKSVLLSAPVTIDSFLEVLWYMASNIQNFNVIFVTRKPLTYFQSQTPWQKHHIMQLARSITVDNVGIAETTQLLQSPTPAFSLRFAQGAVRAVFQHTAGQPYLIQLLGKCLVQHFNQLAHDQKDVDPFFIAEDINEIVTNDEEFKQQLDHYCRTLILDLKSCHGASEDILHALSKAHDGLSKRQIQYRLRGQFTAAQTTSAIQYLQERNLVEERNNKYLIRLGLLRDWLQ